jgi:hypothetical protein
MYRLFRTLLLCVAAAAAALTTAQSATAQPRPTAPQILPHTTLAVVRVPDTQLLVDRFQHTALGQIANDQRIKPLVAQMYQSAQDAFKQIEAQVGLPLNEILKIPQGEISVAFVAPPDLEQPAGVVVVIDTKDQVASARKLIAAAEQIAQKRGGGRAVERFGNEEIAIFSGLGPTPVYAIEREGLFIFATARQHIETLAANYSGAGLEKTLAESDKYNTVMNRCFTAGEEQPQITWYVDPIALVRRLASGSLAATGLALFPVLGLDGLQAVGGSMTFATTELDEIQHLHVLLDNPRMGVIDAVALASGDMNPEPWVPGDCITYSTIHWDLKKTMHVSSKLFNGIMGDGELERQIRTRVSEPLGADFETEILPLLTGRATHVQWVEKPVRINSVTTIVGVQLKDPQAFRPVLDKILQRHASRVEKQRYGAYDYWLIKAGGNRQRDLGPNLRQPLPCVGIVGDCLLMTDSLKAYQEAITAQTNPDNNLTSSLDFKLIASKIRRQPGGDAPSALQFSRPEEGMRFWYDLAMSENTRKRLAEGADRNRFFGSLNQALKDNPLPPFSVLAEYLAPGGGMITSDETGIHYMTFTLKR